MWGMVHNPLFVLVTDGLECAAVRRRGYDASVVLYFCGVAERGDCPELGNFRPRH
jgi:hypothetical protein